MPKFLDLTTAVQTIDQIEDLLLRLGGSALEAGCVRDAQGVVRFVFPSPFRGDFLTLAFDELCQYGIGSVQVLRRQLTALVNRVVECSTLGTSDQMRAMQEERQGLGLSRWRTKE